MLSDSHMNDTVISMISNFLQQKNHYFYKPTRDKDILGELHAPRYSDEYPHWRNSLALKDRKFYTFSFNTDRSKQEEYPINDWTNEGSVSFVYHEGMHYQDYVSKLD